MTYEYKILQYATGDPELVQEREFNRLGSRGWRLVDHTFQSAGHYNYALFERATEDTK